MKARRVPLEQRIHKLPLTQIFVATALIWLPISVYLLNNFKELDTLTFLLFSPLGCIMAMWGIIYFVALLTGYGITNTPTYPGAITLANIELVKPQFASRFEKILLLIISSIFVSISILLFVFAIFIS